MILSFRLRSHGAGPLAPCALHLSLAKVGVRSGIGFGIRASPRIPNDLLLQTPGCMHEGSSGGDEVHEQQSGADASAGENRPRSYSLPPLAHQVEAQARWKARMYSESPAIHTADLYVKGDNPLSASGAGYLARDCAVACFRRRYGVLPMRRRWTAC